MKDKLKKILADVNTINYGFLYQDENVYPMNSNEWNPNFNEYYYLQSPKELLEKKYGVCWDQVELERHLLEKKNIPSKSYFIIAYDNKIEPTHTFLVVENIKYYWIEHSWEPFRGIWEYNTLKELLEDVTLKFEKTIQNQKIKKYKLSLYEYEKPIYGIRSIDFINHCENGKKMI